MRIVPIFTFLAASIAGSVAVADLPLDCAKAIALDRVDDVRRIADQLIKEGGQYSHISLDNAFDCLESATGMLHSYDPETKTFTPDKEAPDLKMKTATEKRQADKEALERFAETQRKVEEVEARTKREVYLRLIESCENMYRQEPDETITNKLCFDVFLSNGLPES